MDILILSGHYPPDLGFANHTYFLSQALSSLPGVTVTVLVSGYLPKSATYYDKKVRVIMIKSANSGIKGLFTYNSSALRFLRKLLQKHQFDIIHSLHMYGYPAGIMKILRKSFVFVAKANSTWKGEARALSWYRTNSLIHNWKNDFFYKEYIVASFFEKWLFNKADEIISVSNEVKGEIVSEYKISPSKINTIYNGAPTEIIKADSNKINSDCDVTKILSVGRLVPRKGVEDLIISVYNLNKKGSNLSLDIIGEGYIKHDLVQLTKQLKMEGKIHFHGKLFSNQVNDFLNNATLAVVPSIYEPCSLFGLESLSHGCPLISSNVGGLSEILTDDHNVVFYRSGKVNDLTVKIQYLIKNTKLRQKMCEFGKRTIQEEFNWNETAKNTVALFEKILTKR